VARVEAHELSRYGEPVRLVMVFWTPELVERLPFTNAAHATGNNALMTPGMTTWEVL